MKTVFKLVVLSFKKSSGWFWAVAGAAGTIADVLQPIAPITSYLFFLSAFVCVGSLVVIILNQSLGVKLYPKASVLRDSP